MKKLIEWLGMSNRWKHLIGGLIIGIFAFGWFTAMYAGTPSHSPYSHHLSRSHKTVSTWSVLYVQDNPAASLCRKSFPLHEF